jgi:signal transduction histidine kinase
MENQDQFTSERVVRGHRQVSLVMDRCLGPFALLGAVLAIAAYFKGEGSLWCVAAFVAMPLLNILTTNLIGIHMMKPFRMELARSFGLNSILSTAVFIFGMGPLANYWPIYLTCAIWTAVVLFTWTRNLRACYAQIGYWIAIFWLANLYLGPRGIHWANFAIATALIAVIPIMLIRMFDLLTDSLESEERARTQMVQASKMSALGEMAGGIAHEINNPLAVIGSKADELLELLEDNALDPAHLQESLEVILKTTTRIANIIKGLRSFSRDGSRDDVQSVDVQCLVEETASLCRERLQTHGVELVIEEVPEGLRFEGRSVEISQVLLNLISNSFDAVKDISAPSKWVKVSALDRVNQVEFRVMDCGPGIPREVRDKIFQPFFTTKAINQGTGLGLSISLGIAKNHGGSLAVDLECKNTCFVLCLPKTLEARQIAA